MQPLYKLAKNTPKFSILEKELLSIFLPVFMPQESYPFFQIEYNNNLMGF